MSQTINKVDLVLEWFNCQILPKTIKQISVCSSFLITEGFVVISSTLLIWWWPYLRWNIYTVTWYGDVIVIQIFILTGNLGSVHDLIFSIPILRRKSLICPITTKIAYPKYVHIATPSGVCSKCSLNVGVLFVDCTCKKISFFF